MAGADIALMAHLMRRAGFGANYDELETLAAKGYEATVEFLLYPEAQPGLPYDLLERYFVEWRELANPEALQAHKIYSMINSKRPLEEKICLFWHGIFCVGTTKINHGTQILIQLNKFREKGLGRMSDLLLVLATDPAMIYYLDNCLSHRNAINENWGRELLELFSLGVGMDGHPNYTEDDVKACARAFTGWTIGNAVPRYPYGFCDAMFLYNPKDHDDSEKTFLGETGHFNGEDIIDIISKQPAMARFISRHLYNFFVADEPPVPTWRNAPPRDPAAIKLLEDEYFRSNYDIRSMLRVLFNSDFFKNARFARVKSPAELVAGTLKLVGDFTRPKPGLFPMAEATRYMGQELLNPPTVEGWHTGPEWIDSGTLIERINFAAEQVGNIDLPGIRAIINRLGTQGDSVSAERLVDHCLDMLGGYELSKDTYREVVAHVQEVGQLKTGTEDFARKVGQALQLIVSTQEYQFA